MALLKTLPAAIAFAALILSGTLWFPFPGSPPVTAGEPRDGKLKKLLDERLAALRVLAKLTTEDYQAGKSSLDQVHQAQQALLAARLELCESDKERISLREENLALAKDFEKLAVQRYQTASAMQSDVIMAQADRLATEIALERAKAKASPASKKQVQPSDAKPKTSEELLAAFARAESFWQQADIAREILISGNTKIIPKMEKYLDTPDRRKRCNAALVLAGLGDKRGLAMIIDELKDKQPRPTDLRRSDGQPDSDGQIRADRYYAALLLGQLKKKEAVPALIEATTDETVNYRAAISLGEIGDKSAVPALRKMAKDFPESRLWAAYGLAALGESEGVVVLTGVVLNDSRWTERRHAVEALGNVGDPRAVASLVKALKDKHVNVRVSAAEALGKIGDRTALPALTEALSDTEATEVNAPTTVERAAQNAIAAIKAKNK